MKENHFNIRAILVRNSGRLQSKGEKLGAVCQRYRLDLTLVKCQPPNDLKYLFPGRYVPVSDIKLGM